MRDNWEDFRREIWTLDMPPSFSSDQSPDLRFTDSITVSQIQLSDSASKIKRPNFKNLRTPQLGTLMAVASPAVMPTLRHFIRNVIIIGSKKQVRRVTAGAIIARMENLNSFRYQAVCKLPRKTMRFHRHCPLRGLKFLNPKTPVATPLKCAGPRPALFGSGASVHV